MSDHIRQIFSKEFQFKVLEKFFHLDLGGRCTVAEGKSTYVGIIAIIDDAIVIILVAVITAVVTRLSFPFSRNFYLQSLQVRKVTKPNSLFFRL